MRKKNFLAIPSVWRLQKMKCIIWTIDALKRCYDPWLWGTCKDNMTSWILLSILIVSDRSFRLIRKWIFQHDEPNSNVGNSVFCVSHIRLWTLQNPLKYAAWGMFHSSLYKGLQTYQALQKQSQCCYTLQASRRFHWKGAGDHFETGIL